MALDGWNVAEGALALVLHAHLPYVRANEPDSLEEDWFFQALIECYLPLLEVLEAAAADPLQQPRLTMGLSPTLLSLLADPTLRQRFPAWIGTRQQLLQQAPADQREAAEHLSACFSRHLKRWTACDGDLIPRFATLQRQGVLDLLTCGATHGYLPLLREHPEAVRAQLRTAVREHQRLIGERPVGIWLPECAYYEGLDQWMRDAGLRYAVLDGHGLLHAKPRPRYGVYAPIVSRQGVAFFGRDSDATLPVWSARDGYPGDPAYREFHRDLGWDLPKEDLTTLGLPTERPLGLKLHRVSDLQAPLDQKQPYQPLEAEGRCAIHARHYLQGRRAQLENLRAGMAIPPLLVAPFDAELFGHWWFEGPRFLGELFRQAPSEGVSFSTLRGVLSSQPNLQLCDPCPSSWGQGGFHDYWLNQSNAWIVPEWSRAGRAMVERCSRGVGSEADLRLLHQAGRELLLAQSSDWSFILRAGTTTELAKERIERHLERFWRLMAAIDGREDLPEQWLEEVEAEDALFPLIQPADWRNVGR
jgi:1,4-alpha-glucan branching enzyme